METLYDGIIVGGGPAGWSAAIYLARAQYRTLVIERSAVGGQIAITADVVNYPGILRTDGTTLMETMRQQAMQFGAECLTATVTALSMQAPIKEVQTEQGTFRAHGLLLATGASPRMAGFQGETEFRGRGVAYCATCDGEFFTGQEVFVIGGNGSGIPVYRKLQRQGIPFAAGVLHENDLDYPVAKALAVQVISERPYEPIGEAAYEEALQVMEKCRTVICSVQEFGSGNLKNADLLQRFMKKG